MANGHMTQLKEYHDGITFLLTAVDVFSKYGFAKPLLNEKGSTVLKDSKRKPVNYQTHIGAEFTNQKFVPRDMCINYYVTFSENKAAVVEILYMYLTCKLENQKFVPRDMCINYYVTFSENKAAVVEILYMYLTCKLEIQTDF